MNTSGPVSLDASTLTTFAATLATLPGEEIRKAKSLFIRNAIADYRMTNKTAKGFLIVFGIMSIIPVFLIVFIPAFLGYRAGRENGRQKIMNALEVWKEDLGSDYSRLLQEIENS